MQATQAPAFAHLLPNLLEAGANAVPKYVDPEDGTTQRLVGYTTTRELLWISRLQESQPLVIPARRTGGVLLCWESHVLRLAFEDTHKLVERFLCEHAQVPIRTAVSSMSRGMEDIGTTPPVGPRPRHTHVCSVSPRTKNACSVGADPCDLRVLRLQGQVYPLEAGFAGTCGRGVRTRAALPPLTAWPCPRVVQPQQVHSAGRELARSPRWNGGGCIDVASAAGLQLTPTRLVRRLMVGRQSLIV